MVFAPAGLSDFIAAPEETGDIVVVAETRSLTFIVNGAAAFAPPCDADTDGLILEGEDIGFAAIAACGEAAETACACELPSTFFRVSSTSAETHPAEISVDFIASRETPSLICDET
jgi:hypothetical protein